MPTDPRAAAEESVYRPDIDGLRAIAVIAVVIFHLNPKYLRGGFGGVDIFFVISGFLISGHVASAIKINRFSFKDFYTRRISRIFPALLIVIAASLGFGWFGLFSDEFKRMGEGAIAGLLFYPNLLLFSQGGYFDGANELKPFLHLWSLGIEEQFYFVWPVVLVITGKRDSRPVVMGLGCLSFLAFIILSVHKPNGAFYLPFARFWELLIGSYLAAACIFGPQPGIKRRWATENAKAAIGLFLIVTSFFLVSRHLVLYPGFRIILQVAGTYLMISAGAAAAANRRILSHPIAVFFGLISYPLYLWHWVLLYGTNILGNGAPTTYLRGIAVSISIALAYLTYRYIEVPIRRQSLPRKRKIAIKLSFCALAVLLLSFVAFWFGNQNLRKNIFPIGGDIERLAETGCGLSEDERTFAHWCLKSTQEPIRSIIFGDSNAHALYNGLLVESASGQNWALIANPGCGPFLGVKFIDSALDASQRANCKRFVEAGIRALTKNTAIKTVVLAMKRIEGNNQPYEAADGSVSAPKTVQAGLERTVEALLKAGKRVALILHNPDITDGPEFCADRPLLLKALVHKPVCSIERKFYDQQNDFMRSTFESIRTKFPEVAIFDPADILCDQSRCNVISEGISLYSYTTHLSDFGSRRVAKKLIPWLQDTHLTGKPRSAGTTD